VASNRPTDSSRTTGPAGSSGVPHPGASAGTDSASEPRMFSPTDPLRDLFESVILEPLAFVASVPKLLASGKAKIESQKKTANMIGKFVVPMAKRKIDAELKTVAESVRSYLTNTESKGSGSRSLKVADLGPAISSVEAPLDESSGSKVVVQSSSKAVPGSKSAKTATPKAEPNEKLNEKPNEKPKAKSVAKLTSVTTPKQARAAKATTKPKPVSSQAPTSKAVPKAPGNAGSVKTPKSKSVPPIVASALTVNDLGLDSYDDLPASSVVGLLEALTTAQLRAISIYEASHRNRQTILGGVARLLDAAQ
jgi:hypothetical protein